MAAAKSATRYNAYKGTFASPKYTISAFTISCTKAVKVQSMKYIVIAIVCPTVS